MSQAPPPVANTGEDAITRTIDVAPEQFTDLSSFTSLEQAYEVDLTLEHIVQGDYQRIALQFADEQLGDAVPVFRALRDRLPPHRELYVLADTTYGSCCVDEVAAQHVDADFVVHYGHTCLSPTARLPVLYILTKRFLSPTLAASSLASSSAASFAEDPPRAVVLLYDVAYAHAAADVADELRKREEMQGIEVVLGSLDTNAEGASRPSASSIAAPAPSAPSAAEKGKARAPPSDSDAPPSADSEPAAPAPPTTIPTSPARYALPPSVSLPECALFYLGPESTALSNVLLTHGACRVWSFDPTAGEGGRARLESARTNRMLMRRYAAVEKAKDADVVGILVGTLGVAAYLPTITHLRRLLAQHHKKSYTVAVGKLNPAKLANFIEVECFVLVACPENSMVDSKEFLRPIVTPFELELALTSKSWTGDYILDFAQLLNQSEAFSATTSGSASGAAKEGEDEGEEEDDEAPVFSSVTGKYRHPRRYDQPTVTDVDSLTAAASALSLRDPNLALSRALNSAGGAYAAESRTYHGLEPRYGLDAPARVEMGREGGVARGYGYEREGEGEGKGEE